jgi:hypothetical protein
VGSNPTQSIQSSVQIPKAINEDKRTTRKFIHSPAKIQMPIPQKNSGQMRDLYNRPKKLAYWLKRIETDLQGQDKEDVLYFVKFMQDHERCALWIIRSIIILLPMREQLRKPFRAASKEDIRALLHWLDENDCRSSSIVKFRKVLNFFSKSYMVRRDTIQYKVSGSIQTYQRKGTERKTWTWMNT